ncbi:MAG: STAS domain-containing protein [Rhodospirillales bacterium]|nr:STAS domain-containing protein [Rhodospirillales bacterium]
MKIVSISDEQIVIELDGELDMAKAPAARQLFFDAWQTGPGDIVLDCKRLSYLDSSGVSAIVYLYRSLTQRRSRNLRIVNISGQPAQLVKIVGFSKLVEEVS